MCECIENSFLSGALITTGKSVGKYHITSVMVT